jgi:hypothetical protein
VPLPLELDNQEDLPRPDSLRNVLRTVDHIFAVADLDPRRLKYLDESRFEL